MEQHDPLPDEKRHDPPHPTSKTLGVPEVLARFIDDNPFRLCGIGSSATLRELRQKANTLELAVKVGLPTDVALEVEFGSEHASRCAGIVRELANDPVQLTLYRIFWPHTYPTAPIGAAADKEASEAEAVFPDPTRSDAHIHFLNTWYAFVTKPGAKRFGEAARAFDAINQGGDTDTLLAEAAKASDENASRETLYRALKEAVDHLLACACWAATQKWQAGDTRKAVKLLKEVTATDFEPDAIGRALKAVLPLGNRERERLEKLTADFTEWTLEQGVPDFTKVESLRALAEVVEKHAPSVASLWRKAADGYVKHVGNVMHVWAANVWNDSTDWERALSAMWQIIALPTPADYKVEIYQDLGVLYGFVIDYAITTARTDHGYPAARHMLTTIVDAQKFGSPYLASCEDRARKALGTIRDLERQQGPTRNSRPINQPSPQVVDRETGETWKHKLVATVVALICGGFVLYLFTALPARDKSVPSTKVSSGTSDTTPSTTLNPTDSVGPPESNQERLNRLNEEERRLVSDMKDASAALDKERTAMEAEQARLQAISAKLRQKRKILDLHSKAAVRTFNQAIYQMNHENNAFDERVKTFNAWVHDYNSHRKRLEEIHKVQKETGN